MPTIQVDDAGHVLYYEDTGPVAGSKVYTTIVLFHGLIFHSGMSHLVLPQPWLIMVHDPGIFKRLLPSAQERGLRLVTVNWRDYPGSSPYTSEELDEFSSKSYEVQRAAMEKQGNHITTFIENFIKKEDIPPLEREGLKKCGGLTVLTWSLGNVFLFPFLANAHRLSEGTRTFLERYLRTAIVFGMLTSYNGQI